MSFDRRSFLTASAGLIATPALAAPVAPPAARPAAILPAQAAAEDPRRTIRAIGNADAPMVVQEFFSLTCSHCGAFARETFPRVKTELINSGRVRFVWRDFPLDQIALRASAVARTFPAEGYEAFLHALFATQDRWAYARGADHKAEIGRIAALAGMPQATFDAAWADDDLARWILEQAQQGEREFRISATPTFIFGSRPVSGNIPFDRFVQEASRA